MSLRREGLGWWLVTIELVLILGGALLLLLPTRAPQTTVVIGAAAINARVVTSTDDQEKGLGGVTHLDAGKGMLFVFSTDDSHPMWMKNMKIDLDMVWLNGAKQVVYIQPNVKASSYPSVYRSPVPSRYVLELPAGTAAQSEITLDKTAQFDLP